MAATRFVADGCPAFIIGVYSHTTVGSRRLEARTSIPHVLPALGTLRSHRRSPAVRARRRVATRRPLRIPFDSKDGFARTRSTERAPLPPSPSIHPSVHLSIPSQAADSAGQAPWVVPSARATIQTRPGREYPVLTRGIHLLSVPISGASLDPEPWERNRISVQCAEASRFSWDTFFKFEALDGLRSPPKKARATPVLVPSPKPVLPP
ncbi:hypothetical protein FB451DRAFT_1393517 [Mycena latifolia]|nr:hypothetical protein FB451DRAFT_1393517 [Mycena latifolia]